MLCNAKSLWTFFFFKQSRFKIEYWKLICFSDWIQILMKKIKLKVATKWKAWTSDKKDKCKNGN